MFTNTEMLDGAVDCPRHIIAVKAMLLELNFTKRFNAALTHIPNFYPTN
jgi:hypothetical protein